MAKIFLIGAGPGTKEHVTPAARESVRRATVVIGAERALELFHDDIKDEAYTLKAGNIDEVLQRALKFAQDGKSVALLSTGDPTFFGLLKTIHERLPSDLELEIVPGISSIQICTSRLQICLEEIGLILSFHGRPDVEKARLLEAVGNGKIALILPDPKFQPNQISNYLIDSGIDPKTPAAVCENLTYDNERITEGDLRTISSWKFDTMCIMVVGSWRRRRLQSSGLGDVS